VAIFGKPPVCQGFPWIANEFGQVLHGFSSHSRVIIKAFVLPAAFFIKTLADFGSSLE
jgi:hypothetical protein